MSSLSTTPSSTRAAPAAPAYNELTGAIRALAMDAIQQANSGHPGMPLGMAEIAEVLWRHHLQHNPANPAWPNRDRFVLSNGHGSMLLYALLHLSGYDLSIEDIRQFRQLHSRTPGHPEYGYTPGVETTTGPLGQGIANAVGMAIAEKMLAHEFNTAQHTLVNHHTYAFIGDGCLMEGVSHEACSLAGTLGLGKLIAFWDDNGISIDGEVDGWFTEDIPARFASYGWHVIPHVNGHDPIALDAAIKSAKAEQQRPTLICCRTAIGMGSPNKANSADVHGSPLGAEEIAATRDAIGWHHAPFDIPATVYAAWNAREAGAARETAWNADFAAYTKDHPEQAAAFLRRMAGELPANWPAITQALIADTQSKAATVATRKASQLAIEALAPHLPELLGGSADLTGSNLTWWQGAKALSAHNGGNYIFYGVREFGMTAIANGIALAGGFIPYTATFMMFSDYARNAIRMAALMKIRQIMVFTHDSIGLGEDGPTHQPIEHAASLRLIPNLDVWRPADATETAIAWISGIQRRNGPTALLLSRQNLAAVAQQAPAEDIARGGYVLSAAQGAKAILIATGSEVNLALDAQANLAAAGIAVNVVSMPSTTTFDKQDKAWQDSVLPRGLPRVAIEAGHPDGWYKYVGLEGAVLGINRFGESAPAGILFKEFGFTVEHVVNAVLGVLSIN